VRPESLAGLAELARGEVAAATDLESVEAVRLRYLARRDGQLTLAAASIGRLPAEERGAMGRAFNAAKAEIEQALAARQAALQQAARSQAGATEWLDLSDPGVSLELGHLHPSTRIQREVEAIFAQLGYRVVEGPEVELDEVNFQLLNIPPEHPARDTQDTFYLTDTLLLRTQTSPAQIRAMWAQPPPLRVITPGRVFRRDNPDATHFPMFHQVEGLCVDEGISFADLKGTLEYFSRSMFGPERAVRLRPSYFPFTEPSIEVDVSCFLCAGAGCRVCGTSGWIEILGAGMVHPQVLRNGRVDPDRYSGFAFGMGPDRIAMLKYGIADGRELYDNDLRFLQQI